VINRRETRFNRHAYNTADTAVRDRRTKYITKTIINISKQRHENSTLQVDEIRRRLGLAVSVSFMDCQCENDEIYNNYVALLK